jgi:hypothetical protein
LSSILLNKYLPNGPSVHMSLDKSQAEAYAGGKQLMTADFDWGV